MTGVEQVRDTAAVASPGRLSRGWHAVLAVVLVAGGVIVLAFKALDGRLPTIRR
jgi:hypothetical protein